MGLIFSASEETVSAYTLRRRLEEFTRDLVDSALAGLSIMEDVLSPGFNSATHFTRSFRDLFGCSSRDSSTRAEVSRAVAAPMRPASGPAESQIDQPDIATDAAGLHKLDGARRITRTADPNG